MTLRALVVDDSRAMRAMVARMLRQHDFEVIEVEHGGQALEWLGQNGPVEVALVDLYMPEVDGVEFVRRVRADARYAAMRILMVTSESELARVALLLESGADEFLMKPFAADAIESKLQLLGLL